MANLAQENNLRTLDTKFLTIGELNHRNRHNFEAQIKFEKTYFFWSRWMDEHRWREPLRWRPLCPRWSSLKSILSICLSVSLSFCPSIHLFLLLHEHSHPFGTHALTVREKKREEPVLQTCNCFHCKTVVPILTTIRVVCRNLNSSNILFQNERILLTKLESPNTIFVFRTITF